MRLIRPSYEIIEQGPGLQGIYDIIEKCGKVSYKSEPKGGETAKKFVEARAKEGHGAVLEFGTVYLTFKYQNPVAFNDEEYDWHAFDAINFYKEDQFSRLVETDDYYYVTTNYRVLVENNRLDDLKYLCEPTEYHEKRYAVMFITDIGLGRDFLRHRVMSMVQESTRCVNYAKEKFGEELTFVIPPWIGRDVLYWNDYPNVYKGGESWYSADKRWCARMEILSPSYNGKRIDIWLTSLEECERAYLNLVNDWDEMEGPWQPQQARGVLPLSTKTEFVLSGFNDAWIHFFRLRSDIAATGKAHPMSVELANPLRDEFIERGYITEDDLEHDTMGAFDVCAADNDLK